MMGLTGVVMTGATEKRGESGIAMTIITAIATVTVMVAMMMVVVRVVTGRGRNGGRETAEGKERKIEGANTGGMSHGTRKGLVAEIEIEIEIEIGKGLIVVIIAIVIILVQVVVVIVIVAIVTIITIIITVTIVIVGNAAVVRAVTKNSIEEMLQLEVLSDFYPREQ